MPQTNSEEKILLALCPYWDPLIMPIGISSLKSFLRQNGYTVTTVDLNIEGWVKASYDRYFNALADFVPKGQRGNFFNIGKDVMRNHMMAHIHAQDRDDYIELTKILVHKTFYCRIDDSQAAGLIEILEDYYSSLENHLREILDRERPTVLGLSVFKGNIPSSLFTFTLAKRLDPHIKTVMGGGVFADQLALGSDSLKEFLVKTEGIVDTLIIGEGERLFLKLLKGELPPERRVFTREDVDNEYLDLNQALLPDFSDFDNQYYNNMAYYTSRGCPFQCTFCSETVRWGKYRKKSPNRVAEEMEILSRKYDNQLFLMCDSLLNPIIDDLSQALIDADLSVYWDSYLRIDRRVCDIKNTTMWRRAGFYRARLGVESGSPHVLRLMRKGISVDNIRAAVSNLAEAGIKTTTMWVVGHPGETERDFQETLDLIEELRDDIYEAECNAFWYFPNGQVSAPGWEENQVSLYPEEYSSLLMIPTHILDVEPKREEIYRRTWRFVEHCEKLGIPNPYSLQDIFQADQRWQRLHKNAVPPVVLFRNHDRRITENRDVKMLLHAQEIKEEDGDFDF